MRISVGRIPKYITASSPKSLRRSMLKVQVNLGYGVEFFDIQVVNKKWFAWYYDNNNIDMHDTEEKINE